MRWQLNAAMYCLMTGIYSEKCVIRQFHHYVNIIKYSYINLDGRAYYTYRLFGIPLSCIWSAIDQNAIMWYMTILHCIIKNLRG